MEYIRQNFATFFRTLQILFFALLGGQVIVLVVFEFLQRKPSFVEQAYTGEMSAGHARGLAIQLPNDDFKASLLIYGIPLLALGLIGLAFFLYRKTVAAAREKPHLSAKLLAYRSALILKWALIEAATLLALVGYFLSGLFYLLLLAAGAILFFIRQIPTRQQLSQALELSAQEQALLEDPQAVVVEYRVTRN